MNQRIVQVAALTLLLATQVSLGFSQTSSELKNFLSQRLGLRQDQIAAIQHGQPFAKNAEPHSPAEIFVIGVYINAAPEAYVKFVSDFNLARLVDYQKEGTRAYPEVYNDKGQKVNVADQFKYILSYYQVLPRDLPAFNKYIVDYPNAKLPNVENTFRWERADFGLKPTLFIIHVLTLRGEKPGEDAYDRVVLYEICRSDDRTEPNSCWVGRWFSGARTEASEGHLITNESQ